jgi:hypothetical protein
MGHRRIASPIGERFGRLVVLEEVEPYRKHIRQVRCKCDCGDVDIYRLLKLLYKRTKSCGCFRRDFTIAKNTTHGRRHTPLWNVWRKMMERCYNKNDATYQRYGAKGITVCERWHNAGLFMDDLQASFDDHVEKFTRKDTALDRIDSKLGYSPENCRWVTYRENNWNKESTRWIEFNGESHPSCVWSKRLGLGPQGVYLRLKKGWSIERAVTEPRRITRRNRHLNDGKYSAEANNNPVMDTRRDK